MSNPKVTVLMPVYNSEKYLRETIQSILAQTFTDFEFLIVNDKSTDSSLDIIHSFSDSRLRIVDNKYAKGIVGALNTGIELAEGEYIARMDSDDIAMDTRLEKQVAFLDRNQEFGLCGSWFEMFGKYSGIRVMPQSSDLIKATMLFYSGIAHPTVMMRKSVLMQNDLRYSEEYLWTEDQDFWVRMLEVTKFTNIPEVLLKYRTHESSVGQVHNQRQIENIRKLHHRLLGDLGISPTDQEMTLHERLGYWDFGNSRQFFADSIQWFKKIQANNSTYLVYDNLALSQFLSDKIIDIYRSYNSFSVRKLFRSLQFFWLETNLNLKLKLRMSLKIIYTHLK